MRRTARRGRHDQRDQVPEETTETVIDDEILETEFKEFIDKFDRFAYLCVFNLEGTLFRVIPYIYARNIEKIQEKLETVPIHFHPELIQYSVKDEVLIIQHINPEALCTIIDKYHDMIPHLYRELRDLQALDLFDDQAGKSLSNRLNCFLCSIKVGKSDGMGIFWLPENYQGETDEIDQDDNEDYEDFIRRRICTHIKCRRLPMAQLINPPVEHFQMLAILIRELRQYDGNTLIYNAQLTHFVTIFKDLDDLHDISHEGIKVLMAEEFRCIKNEIDVSANNSFVFNSEQLDRTNDTVKTAQAREYLRYYVGNFLDELDLSRSFITGSAITASLINTSRSNEYVKTDEHIRDQETQIRSRNKMIEILYPPVITKIEGNVEELREGNINLWNISAISDTEGIMTKGERKISFSIKSGSDVDIAVDNTVSDDEYRKIAAGHFEVVRKHFPSARIREYTKPKGDWNYVIYTNDLALFPIFRQIEIYRSSFRNICSHHVGAVRGAYTSMWSQQPQFYLTASAVFTSRYKSTPNYHYFAGRKSNPQDVIVKNKQRGILILDQSLTEIIGGYEYQSEIVYSYLPFYLGNNVPYSIFAAPIEYEYALEERILRENRNRRNQRPIVRRNDDLLPRRDGPRLGPVGVANTGYGYVLPPVSPVRNIPGLMLNENALPRIGAHLQEPADDGWEKWNPEDLVDVKKPETNNENNTNNAKIIPNNAPIVAIPTVVIPPLAGTTAPIPTVIIPTVQTTISPAVQANVIKTPVTTLPKINLPVIPIPKVTPPVPTNVVPMPKIIPLVPNNIVTIPKVTPPVPTIPYPKIQIPTVQMPVVTVPGINAGPIKQIIPTIIPVPRVSPNVNIPNINQIPKQN